MELGFAIAPAWREQGLATAAVEAMLRQARDAPEVTLVVRTRRRNGGVHQCARECGFGYTGELPELDLGTVWRFRLELD